MSTAFLPIRSPADSAFRLLVPVTGPAAEGVGAIAIGGIQWIPTEYAQIPTTADAPEYTCVSYSWGLGRVANPFVHGVSISDRAIPAIEATINSLRPSAIWVDVLCVPPPGLARAACLKSLGAIFHSATQVAVVLSEQCSVLLDQVNSTGAIDPAVLVVLENDDWVDRAWTYQEIVNSRNTYFITEGSNGVAVSGHQLLNSVLQATSDFKKANVLDSFKWRAEYPILDRLENVIADYLISDFQTRSAYQVMSMMDRRSAGQDEDYFAGMIGAITALPTHSEEDVRLDPAEYFMRICEAKQDYSFLYCDAPRSKITGSRWRPVVKGRIRALLPWLTFGNGQSGSLHSTHLRLNNMCFMPHGTVNADARKLIDWWIQGNNTGSSTKSTTDLILARLVEAGFTGCGESIELETGYFFPQARQELANEGAEVVVAISLAWTHGSPGFLVRRNGSDIHYFCGVGVFVGRVPKVGSSVNIE